LANCDDALGDSSFRDPRMGARSVPSKSVDDRTRIILACGWPGLRTPRLCRVLGAGAVAEQGGGDGADRL
jgi:hypothetical protein